MICSFSHKIRSLAEFQAFSAAHARQLAAQRAFERELATGRNEFSFEGYCTGCGKVVPLKVDLQWGNGVSPNWRERLECSCGLNNRVRASLDFLGVLLAHKNEPSVYATEQVTAMFSRLRSIYPKIIGSEFLRDGTTRGRSNANGIRHEDVTSLSFPDETFDAVLSFDVLEHVPNFRMAFGEIARVLKPNGHLLASFPFDANQASTIIRASLTPEGAIINHLPPEFHGDPVDNSGCLCFQVFGWDVLDEMRRAGFSDAYTVVYWSADRGYLGPNQLAIIGCR